MTATNTTTAAEPLPYDKKLERRREQIARVHQRLAAGQRFRDVKQLYPTWSADELAIIVEWAEKIQKKESTYWKACKALLAGPLAHRTFEAIRKKLKNWVRHGEFH
jgi:hypothetical protein